MSRLIALDALLDARQVWRARPAEAVVPGGVSTGIAALDALLPQAGWPPGALSEVLIPADGVGELQLLWPTLARLSQGDGIVALVAPPYRPFAPAWLQAGLRLSQLQVIAGTPREALWAAEQCLRSGACAAVVCWPWQADDRALRRLQVAAETGQGLGFAFRPQHSAGNPSPAPLRLSLDARPRQVRVLKCRGATAPACPIPLSLH